MKNTIDEKKFIIENKPCVQITSADYGFVCGREGNGDGEADLMGEFSFVSKEAVEAEENNKDWETLLVTLHCKDMGGNLPQKQVYFCGEAQVFDPVTGRDYSLTPPSIVFPHVADAEGNFIITISIALDETLPGEEVLVEELVNHNAIINLTQVRFENGFVCEKLDALTITLSSNSKEISVEKEGLSYSLAAFGENAENEENANETM